MYIYIATMAIMVSMVDRSNITSIQLGKDTKAQLDQLIRNKGETYDQIIKRLIMACDSKRAEALETVFMKGVSAANKKVKG
jgi:hypothetical protein